MIMLPNLNLLFSFKFVYFMNVFENDEKIDKASKK